MKRKTIDLLSIQSATKIYNERQGISNPEIDNPKELRQVDPRIERIKTLADDIALELGIMKEAAVSAAVNLVLFDDMKKRHPI